MRRIIFFSALLLPFFWSCEDPNVRVDQLDPAIQAKFIDIDSLISLEKNIAAVNAGIFEVNDSLAVIDSLEIAGDQTDYTQEIASLNEILDQLRDERSELTSQQSAVSRGEIRIDAITAAGAPKEMTFTESRENYRLPLDPRSTVTLFEVLYKGEIRTARFIYTTDTVKINRTVRIIARNLILSGTSYDSARFTCDTIECSSINAKAIFYM